MRPEKTRKRFGNWVFRSPNNRIRLRGDRNEEVKTQNVFFSRIPAFFFLGNWSGRQFSALTPLHPSGGFRVQGYLSTPLSFFPAQNHQKDGKEKKKHYFFGSFPVAAQITFPFFPFPFVTNDAGHSKKFRKNRKHNPISLTPRRIIGQQRIVHITHRSLFRDAEMTQLSPFAYNYVRKQALAVAMTLLPLYPLELSSFPFFFGALLFGKCRCVRLSPPVSGRWLRAKERRTRRDPASEKEEKERGVGVSRLSSSLIISAFFAGLQRHT